ncbi:MAG: hypothetical protein M1818_005614 [Claussenomyces sp. TS43310]|nr:MAG: hypothetical protein M1818_005614 [Claussenomyces sp. TS43310]
MAAQYPNTYEPPAYHPDMSSGEARLSLKEGDSISSPIHYTRDPTRLIAYLVPFPKPALKHIDAREVPQRLLVYTPPPPPLMAPAEGEKEARLHKVQRKWENEIREAKTNPQKVASWKGLKGRATKGIDKAMNWTKSSNLEFLNRVPTGKPNAVDKHADDGHNEGDETHKTVGLQEMVLVYPDNMPGTQEQIRTEFIENMLRTKSKAERDAVLATGLIPVTFGIDILATVIWPFGGLGEIDTVWAYANIRGAKTARSVTKRLNSSGTSNEAKLKLTFTPSSRLEVLSNFLSAQCHDIDAKLFPQFGTKPTEEQAIAAIGWTPSETGGETKNWEDEQWELSEVKDDLRQVMRKGAKEWNKWSKAYEKNPEKALKK